MSQEKRMTVEEIAKEIIFKWLETSDQPGLQIQIQEALISFAAQEAEPLVEAVEFYVSQQKRYGYKELKEALTAHRAKYPKKDRS